MGAAELGPDAGQHPKLVLAHRREVSDLLITMDWPSNLSSQLTLVAIPRPFLSPLLGTVGWGLDGEVTDL